MCVSLFRFCVLYSCVFAFSSKIQVTAQLLWRQHTTQHCRVTIYVCHIFVRYRMAQMANDLWSGSKSCDQWNWNKNGDKRKNFVSDLLFPPFFIQTQSIPCLYFSPTFNTLVSLAASFYTSRRRRSFLDPHFHLYLPPSLPLSLFRISFHLKKWFMVERCGQSSLVLLCMKCFCH